MARQASPDYLMVIFLIMFLIVCFVCFMKHFLADVITLLLRIVNLRSKGKATSRLVTIRIVYPNYSQIKTDLTVRPCREGQPCL